ncbi:MAG: 4-hydroxy-3-methylbut-2-enyl diphosphate reductase [Lachnospiraceae bacterium]|nr:4-hydroxy-3-methylbut-2-enyl diphosphate reductase [Lachnospiraceae bacterium]
MRTILADKAGFCFGVSRAMELVEEQIRSEKQPLYSYGPMIHNEEVVNDLARRGVQVTDLAQALANQDGGTMLIRSHGITRDELEKLKEAGYEIVDGTCPFVSRIHRYVDDYSRQGYQIVIIGDPAHAEVKGICGWVAEGSPIVIRTPEEAKALSLPQDCKVCVVSQTTFNLNKFQEIIEIIRQKGYYIKVCETICAATRERQEAAQVLAREVDAMIVIGGKDSSNTRKLYEICAGICPDSFLIQTKDDLDPADFHSFDCVGITAGASTPNIIIEEVQNHVRKF